MNDPFGEDEVLAAIDRQVESLLGAMRLCGPPVNVVQLARHLGIAAGRGEADRGHARWTDGGRGIPRRPRAGAGPVESHWDLAIRVGLDQARAVWRALGVPAEEVQPGARRRLARLFAARLVVPTLWFGADVHRLHFDLLALQSLYATAPTEEIAWRFLDVDDRSVVTLFDNGRVTARRGRAARVLSRLHPLESACQQYVHAWSRAHAQSTPGISVQGWPLHRVDWKREVLQTCWEGESCD